MRLCVLYTLQYSPVRHQAKLTHNTENWRGIIISHRELTSSSSFTQETGSVKEYAAAEMEGRGKEQQ